LLVCNSNQNKLNNTKFSGEYLSTLEQPLKAAKDMAKHIFAPMFPFLKHPPIVTIFGEWIQDGTATSKDDKFEYQKRSIKKGHFYGFGVSLTFDDQQNELTPMELKKVTSVLKYQGFAPILHQDDAQAVMLMLNCPIIQVFNRFKILTVPVLQTLPFVKVFDKMALDLLEQKVEGFVINIPSEGVVLKWKGCEDINLRRTYSLVDIATKISCQEALEPLDLVLQYSIRFTAQINKKRNHDLEHAYNSARSKYPRLTTLWPIMVIILVAKVWLP
jgi:hypothetical protein